MTTIKVPQLAWYEPRDLELTFPDSWQVEVCYMTGYNRSELTIEELRAAIRNPIGSKRLSEIARNKKEVAILFDDTSRVTRTAKIVPLVLEELSAAGIPDKHIRFICAVGVHAPLYRQDMVKKLGEDTVARFRCFNHNPFGNCANAGVSKTFKTDLYINEEYLKCDLKIAIGACVPHVLTGFGGGGKIIMPGIASYESILSHHRHMFDRPAPGFKNPMGMGITDGNLLKQDIEECAALAGIDFFINAIVNLWGETVSLHAGEWKQSFKRALEEARIHYRTPSVKDKDIVIVNNYAKANEASLGINAALPMLKKDKPTDIVIIANAPEGQVPHYLVGRWGRQAASPLATPAPVRLPATLNQVIVFSEYPHPGSSWWGEDPKIKYMSRWDDVISSLRANHHGSASVAVIPDATNQYFGEGALC